MPINGGAAQPGTKTFQYTGKDQSFSVPSGVSKITVTALGAKGGGYAGGLGGKVAATIPVKSGETLTVVVGGEGSKTHGGFNGGGAGGAGKSCDCPGYGGGGASDLREGNGLANRILVAAGGAGQGGNGPSASSGAGPGGAGGGLTGGIGGGGPYNYQTGGGGFGGTQSAGGDGGVGGSDCERSSGRAGTNGSSGNGGAGGDGGRSNGHSAGGGGGGGGGGYYGGGGAGGGCAGYTHYDNGGGGGGGGSSYFEPSAIDPHTWTGAKKAKGNGVVVISWQ